MNILIVIIGVLISLGILLRVWNFFSRRYNHKILTNSKCLNCGIVLGKEPLKQAIQVLEKQKENLKSEAKLGRVTLHEMKLKCPECGAVNFEKELYKSQRKV